VAFKSRGCPLDLYGCIGGVNMRKHALAGKSTRVTFYIHYTVGAYWGWQSWKVGTISTYCISLPRLSVLGRQDSCMQLGIPVHLTRPGLASLRIPWEMITHVSVDRATLAKHFVRLVRRTWHWVEAIRRRRISAARPHSAACFHQRCQPASGKTPASIQRMWWPLPLA
jgi:hypothetical protein